VKTKPPGKPITKKNDGITKKKDGITKKTGKSGMSLRDVMTMIEGITGKQQITPLGKPAKKKDGTAKMLLDSAVKQYGGGMRLIGEITGCGDKDDFVACLRDTDMVIAKLRKRYPKDSILKKSLGVLTASAKYLPDFRRALGEDAHQVYRDNMVLAIKAAEAESIEQTESRSIIPIDRIKSALADVRKKFVEGPKFIEAMLQVQHAGIRDDLGDISVVESERKAKQQDSENYYVPRTKRLVIRSFKTENEHSPYEFTLTSEQAKLIDASLAKNPRTKLFKRGVGTRVSRTFKTARHPQIGVNVIRHSWITNLLGNNPSEANIRKIAERFKHSPTMTTRYFRGDHRIRPRINRVFLLQIIPLVSTMPAQCDELEYSRRVKERSRQRLFV
jgi:hypothetical protein